MLAQSWLTGVDPRSTAPVFEKTVKSVFTICTYCVPPTSPLVSGGRQLQPLGCSHGGPNGRQAPSKFCIGPEIGPLPLLLWTTGSLTLDSEPTGFSASMSLGVIEVGGVTGRTGSELTAGPARHASDLDHAEGHRGAEAGRLGVQRQGSGRPEQEGQRPDLGPDTELRR